MKKAFGILGVHVLLAVVCAAVFAGPIDNSITLRLTDVPTNATADEATWTGAEGWLESITVWPDTAGGTFTGNVVVVLIETNGLASLGNEIVLYSNATVIAKTTFQPRRNVHQITTGTATNTTTILVRYPIARRDKLVLRAQNTVLAANKNVTAFFTLEK